MQVFQAGSMLRHGLQFAADGRHLLVLSGWPVLFDTLGADPPVTLRPPDGLFAAYARLARDGSSLVYLMGNDLHAWNRVSGEVAKWPGAGADVKDLAVSPDGMTVYAARMTSEYHYWRTKILAFDVATGAPTATYQACESGVGDLSVSADGRRLVAHGSYDACAWDLTRPDDTQAVALLRVGGVGNYVAGVAVSADGARMATITSRGLQFWDLEGETVRELFRSGKHKRRVSAVACSPTKPLIATGDAGGTVFLWDHAGRVLNRYDWGLSTEVFALRFAPDGQRCCAANGHGKLVVWDIDA
jgi:WD40 repeat protein